VESNAHQASPAPLIRLDGVSRTYHLGTHEVRALRDVDLTICEGEFVAIMGASGSGKSTLMHILGLLDRPDAGEYRLDGRPVSSCGSDELARLRNEAVGFVFQQFNLLSRTRATDNAALPLLYSHRCFPAGHVTRLLAQVGLADRAHHRPNELSGGQQQRVAIARALMNGPRLILADEPTGNLDTQSAHEIMDILKGLNEQGMTVVVVTHESDIAACARRTIVMRDGCIRGDERRMPENAAKTGQAETAAARRRFQNLRAFGSYFTLAFRALVAHKVRALLSMLGILIGVASVVAMMALGAGANEAVRQQFASMGSNLLSVRPGTWKNTGVARQAGLVSRFTLDDARALKAEIPAITNVTPVISARAQVQFGNKNWRTDIDGVTPAYAAMRSATPTVGRFFADDEVQRRMRVAVLGTTVVRELFGDRNPVGEFVKINRVIFQVVGVLPAKGATGWRDRDDVVVIPITTAMYRLMGKPYPNNIDVQVAEGEDLALAQTNILKVLMRRHRIPPEEDEIFFIHNMAEIREAMSATSRTMSLLLSAIAAISLVVGGIGIMNITLVSVTERVREIGLRVAVGARRRDILGQFLVEAVAVSVTGGALGVAMGVGISQAMAGLAGWSVIVSSRSVAVAFGCSAAIGLVFGLWPARRASLMNPIEALRYE
jgi:macrolide transport system ATP-binding/permease protein